MSEPGKNNIALCTCAFGLQAGEEGHFQACFENAMEAGFGAFEFSPFDGDRKALVKAAKASGAKIIAVHGSVGFPVLSANPEERNRELEREKKYLEPYAELAPCRLVEHYLDRFLAPAPGRFFRDSTEKLLEYAEKTGFLFCMENVPYSPWLYERYSPLSEVVKFVRSYGPDRMFMTIDINHLNLRENPVKVLPLATGLIRHVHVSDNHGEREEHLIPGNGTIDFLPILRTLCRCGYHGPFNFECKKITKGKPVDKTVLCNLYSRVKEIVDAPGKIQ